MRLISFLPVALLATLGHCGPTTIPCLDLEVKTRSGVLTGFIDPSIPDVRQFLGVPFSRPPTGNRRWLPPAMLISNMSRSATNIGPSCPQLLLRQSPLNTSVYAPAGGNQTEAFPLQTEFSEDCLTLNVWTPLNITKATPVIVWFFGGGFTQGGTSSLYFNPRSWVQRTQNITVVTVNFRSNIFGFPNSASLSDQNLGLLDQRLALKWIRDNIAAFGGDPSRIINWGESAGSIAVDYLDFAYYSDPIVSGRIMASGTALLAPMSTRITTDSARKNFTAVAEHFDCLFAEHQVECLRSISWQEIQAFLSTPEGQKLVFLPVPDEKVVFSNYTRQYELNAISSVPAIIGTNQHEIYALAGLASSNSSYAQLDFAGNQSFLCTAATTSRLRAAAALTTFRYRYDGNFSNISPGIFKGAYHGSELPLIFGTAGEFHGESTEYEDTVSARLQDMWVAFADDPHHGLEREGWSSYAQGKTALLGGEKKAFELVDIDQLDGICAHLPSLE